LKIDRFIKFFFAKYQGVTIVPQVCRKHFSTPFSSIFSLVAPKKKTSSCKIIQFKDAKKKIVSAGSHRITPSILADIDEDIEFY
jgi:hypothetical protein